MKIGMIVYSKTGHTYEAASRLAEKLTTAGHEAVVEKILLENENETKDEAIRIAYAPPTDGYDVLVFGAPVWAFALSGPMKLYFEKMPPVPKGTTILCFVTMGFPFAFLGGTRAIAQMEAMLSAKSGTVLETAVVGWGAGGREARINEMTNRFCRKIQA